MVATSASALGSSGQCRACTSRCRRSALTSADTVPGVEAPVATASILPALDRIKASLPPGMQAPQVSDIQQQRQSGTRFLGCINGTHKFMKTTGERVTFSPAQINRAVKDGELPACR